MLHMLRRVTGDELFFKSLNLYCTRHRGANVITQDLQRAFEDTTGRNLDFFFDQWVYKEGHPEIEVTSSFDDKKKLLSITVKQTHKTGDTIASAFTFPVTIALMDADGQETRHRVEINEREQGFTFAMDKAPKAVRFDPEHDVLKTLKHKRGREALEAALRHAPEAIGRANAARELGDRRQSAGDRGVARRDAHRQILGRAGGRGDRARRDSHDRGARRAAGRTQAAASEGAARSRARARQFSRRRARGVGAGRRRQHRRCKLLRRGRGGAVARQDARRTRVRASDGRAQARLVSRRDTHARDCRDGRAARRARDRRCARILGVRQAAARAGGRGGRARAICGAQGESARRDSRFHDAAGGRSRVHAADADSVSVSPRSAIRARCPRCVGWPIATSTAASSVMRTTRSRRSTKAARASRKVSACAKTSTSCARTTRSCRSGWKRSRRCRATSHRKRVHLRRNAIVRSVPLADGRLSFLLSSLA